MKKKKSNLVFILKILSLIFILSSTVFWATITTVIPHNTSNDNRIQFSPAGHQTQYANVNGNSSIIGNEIRWEYFDTKYGSFKLDWSSNPRENVRFIGSTSKCSSGYGYKIWGKAYSQNAWYITFNKSESEFVYYCENDNSLHGKAYSPYIGYQDFEGLQFSLVSGIQTYTDTKSDIFVNDTTDITELKWMFINHFQDTQGSSFYIIK